MKYYNITSLQGQIASLSSTSINRTHSLSTFFSSWRKQKTSLQTIGRMWYVDLLHFTFVELTSFLQKALNLLEGGSFQLRLNKSLHYSASISPLEPFSFSIWFQLLLAFVRAVSCSGNFVFLEKLFLRNLCHTHSTVV